ncbi:MAG: hypothetical protein K0Q73_7703 [Paenibacillus sp.]|jgi:hypothetical protein|nr:hypothetical protein [Paenibacillus sp.]
MELYFNRDRIKKVKKGMIGLVRANVSNPTVFEQIVRQIEAVDSLEVCAAIPGNIFELTILSKDGLTIYTYEKKQNCLLSIQYIGMKQFSHLLRFVEPHLEEYDTEYCNLKCRASENFSIIVGESF